MPQPQTPPPPPPKLCEYASSDEEEEEKPPVYAPRKDIARCQPEEPKDAASEKEEPEDEDLPAYPSLQDPKPDDVVALAFGDAVSPAPIPCALT
jgi:hypothetical protein